jgi:hypothetical protein
MDCVWQNDFGTGSEFMVVEKGKVDNRRDKKYHGQYNGKAFVQCH